MSNKTRQNMFAGTTLLAAFVIWTILIQLVDVQPVGQNGTNIGLATINTWFHELTGTNMVLYTVTDWLGLVPIGVCIGFALLGAVQLVRRKNLLKVDPDILLLGVYYVMVIFCYLFFETVPINYRPIPLEGIMEASYPSSTTLLVLSVMSTLSYQVGRRSYSKTPKAVVNAFVIGFSVFMVIGRLVCGVHWATDIVGSILLASGLFLLYLAAVGYTDDKQLTN